MENRTQHGYLVLADISGYTSYVAKTELEHAHDILGELLELIVSRLTPTLTLSKLEGDAVFVYAPEVRLSRGETVMELIEATYAAFKDRVEGIRRRTTCDCNACRNIPMLDLKFITHHGDYILQSVGQLHELVGSDVNLIHRLLKNHVNEATGWRAYALFTDRALECIGVQAEGMHHLTEEYEHLGQVETHSLDLRTRYQEIVAARHVFVNPDQSDVTLTVDLAAPPPVVWNWLGDPHRRAEWQQLDIRPQFLPKGRTGVGARNHCVHGKDYAVENILDWKPFDYLTFEYLNSSGAKEFEMTIRLTPLPNSGTRLALYARMVAPMPRLACRVMANVLLGPKFRSSLSSLAGLLAAEVELHLAGQLSGAALPVA